MNTYTLIALILISCFTASAEQLKATFSYTTTGYRDFHTAPAALASTPAFLIFDTELQQVKVFNFIDKELQVPDAFNQHRIYEVSKRESNEAIKSLPELFDFLNVAWEANKERDYGGGLIIYMTFEVNESGDWFGSEYGGLLGGGSSGSGSIIGYEPYVIATTHGSPSIDIQESFYYVRTPTSAGYSYEVFSTEALGSWNEIDPSISANLSDAGNYIGSGEYLLIESGPNSSRPTKKFYRTIVTPLQFSD